MGASKAVSTSAAQALWRKVREGKATEAELREYRRQREAMRRQSLRSS